MVVAGLTVSFSLVDVNNCGITEFLWQMLLVPHSLKQACQLATDCFVAHRVLLCGNGIGAGAFPLVTCLIVLLTSSLEGGASSSWLIASCGRRAIASLLMAAGRFSTLLK